MEKDILENYLRAGNIASSVREKSRDIVKVGKSLTEIVEEIESLIKKEGAQPAFPVNISINDVAAHFTPTIGDTGAVKENDMVKIDVGVHVDGFVADTAVTVNFNKEHDGLVKAVEKALAEAVKLAIPGMHISEISRKIEETITGEGFKPVANLTGHGISRYDLHTEPSIPNVAHKSDIVLEENQVIAIEPFATNGAGFVKDSDNAFIFSLVGIKPVRNTDARKIIDFAQEMNGLPFAERWIPIGSLFKIRLALRELRERGNIHDYYVLKEVAGGLVSQAEHSIIVKDKPIVLTE